MEKMAIFNYFMILHMLAIVADGQSLSYIGQINITLPGFSTIYEHNGWTDPRERYSILQSTFSAVPFTRDSTFVYYHVGKYLDDLQNFAPTLLYDDFTWPREPSQTPVDVFEFGLETVNQPDGFLPPGKNDGSIFIIDVTDFNNPVTYDIVRDPANPDPVLWFYHRVTWKDMNLDGRKDALTCRTRRIDYADEIDESEMLWFEQPDNDPLNQPWVPHIINQNICGTFQVEITFDIPGEGPIDAVFTPGYFTQILAVHWTTNPTGSWEDPADVQTRVIDTGHKFFDISASDVNNDGRPELIITYNAAVNGSFVVYEIPDDFRTGEYILHVLADGFSSTSGAVVGGSPGTGQAYYPTDDESGKPWLILSGDDDGTTYELVPQSEDPTNWDYDLNVIRDEGEGNIVGRPSAVDVDGDGYKEVFIPIYYGDAVHVYTYAP